MARALALNGHLTKLETTRDVGKVRGEADETVKQIAAALRARAENLRG